MLKLFLDNTKNRNYTPALSTRHIFYFLTFDDISEKPDELHVKGKYYSPEPLESPAAQGIGYSAIMFMIIFLVCIVLLDLATICKDFRRLRQNLKHFMKKSSTPGSSKQDLHNITEDQDHH